MNARLIILASFFAIGGCVETRFESTPGDHIEACDVRWKGLWVDASETPTRDDGDLAFLVDDDCRFHLLERPEKDGPFKPVHIPLNFVHDGDHDYVVVADNQLAGVVKLAAVHGVKPIPGKSFFIARYRVRGDRLEIDTVDSQRAAHMVIDELLGGTVDRSPNELHVFVRGDRARVLEILRTQPIFASMPSATLERSRQTLAEFEAERMRARKPR